MGRAPCCDKANVKKGPWSPEEDLKLKDYIHKYGTGGNWISLPQKAGLRRCGKSCRLRWLNYLRPNIKHGEFSDEEDRIICTLFASIGSRWSIMAAHLPGRTDNDIKNYWNTKLKKKLLAMQLLPPSPPPPLLSSPSSSSFHHLETAQHTSSPSPSSLHRDYNPMLMMSPYDYHHHTPATPFLQNHGHYYQEDAVKENYNGSREIKQEEGIGVYMPSNDTNIGENSNEALFCNSWFDHNPIMMNDGCFGQTHQSGLLQEDVLHAEMEEPLGIGTCNSGFFFSGGESKATASTSTSTGYQSEEVVMYH